MPLTTAQLQALKADIAANTATITFGGASVQVKNVPATAEGNEAVAAWYNLAASPSYWIVRTDAPVEDVLNNITWANFTPKDAVSGGNAAQASACSNYCQGKMLNVQTMTFGRTAFNATKPNQTAGLKDATTQLPSDTAFANQTGGWPNIIPVLQRMCTNAEKLFAAASTVTALRNAGSNRGTLYDGTNGNPDVPVFEGPISGITVLDARNS